MADAQFHESLDYEVRVRERIEQEARIFQMVNDALLKYEDAKKRQQDIRYAPFLLAASGFTAGAAAAVALTALLKWLWL